jgi:hypothetical protein
MLESVLNLIDPKQPTLQDFVNTWRPRLKVYTNFLYGKYQTAVNGILKTDMPTPDEMLGMFWLYCQFRGLYAHPSTDPTRPTNQSWGAPDPFYYDGQVHGSGPVAAYRGNGFEWNGMYGAAETYPQYGFYGNAETNAQFPFGIWSDSTQSVFTTAYIVSHPDFGMMVSDWRRARVVFDAGGEQYISMDHLTLWTIPWLQNRLILGSMACWKAIYLLNGYDHVWSLLQALQRLAALDPPIVPPNMRLEDGTIASGNWSLRELCNVVQAYGLYPSFKFIPDNFGRQWHPIPTPPGLITSSFSGYSVRWFLGFLYNVANGDWAGPPEFNPIRDGGLYNLSFRSLLATAAMAPSGS